jgi:hypothetical protein
MDDTRFPDEARAVLAALADAFGFRGVQGIDLPAAWRRSWASIWRASESGNAKAASSSASPRMRRPMSRTTRPNIVRIALSARLARLKLLGMGIALVGN